MLDWQTLSEKALTLQKQGQFSAAEQIYQQLVQQYPKEAENWHALGKLYYQIGRYSEALSALIKALEISRFTPAYHQTLGLIFEKLGDLNQAVQAYQNVIKLDAGAIAAYLNLGQILSSAGDWQNAEALYRQAIAANPNQATLYHQLGLALVGQVKFDQAIEAHQKAHELAPQDFKILEDLGEAFDLKANECQLRASFYLGFSLYRQEKYLEAVPHYQTFLAIRDIEAAPESIQRVYRYLGDCFQKLNQHPQAISVYQEGIERYPDLVDLRISFMAALRNSGRTDDARMVAAEASERFPEHLLFRRDRWLMLPIIYESVEEIQRCREHFAKGLEQLIETTPLNSPEEYEAALKNIGAQTNFYLHYQGQSDVKLQSRYGRFLHQMMAAVYPQWSQPLPLPDLEPNEKIRVGYISTCLWKQTVAVLFLGWLRHCDREKFEVYSYHLHANWDEFTDQFKRYSDVFHHLPAKESIDLDYIATVAEQVRQDQPHILVFLDVGMHPYMNFFSSLRLAPVQCVTWGHPVTTGSPTMDYFLSSGLMEPEFAQDHYSEQLVRLPNISIAYAYPKLETAIQTRSDFQFAEDQIIYLSCQTLFKYLPQYDYIFPEIALRVPAAKFAFISHKSAAITEKFLQRLQRAFAPYGLSQSDYCIMLPRQGHRSYLSLNRASDIFLDTLSWSGGNTALEAIACGLPIVTCPGSLMRSRHSSAILTMLGVTETIAETEADYIEIAVRLGLDAEWRSQIVQKIQAQQTNLYDDPTCIKALEAFYQQVVHPPNER